MKKLFLAGVAVLALSASAHASPSFSCHRATWLDEVAICQNVQLAALDRQLEELYAMAMDIYKGGFQPFSAPLDGRESRLGTF